MRPPRVVVGGVHGKHPAQVPLTEDQHPIAPEVAMTVAVAEPGRTLVLRGGIPMGSVAAPFDCTWAFVLREEPDGTRLVSRERYGYLRWWAGLVVAPTSVISFVMSRKMLHGIVERAEHAATDYGLLDRSGSR